VTPAAIRPLAEQDLIERSRNYRRQGGAELAERFFDAAIAALQAIDTSPGIGSPRVGDLIGLDGLRRISLEGFPCGWLYLVRPDFLDVIRLLAAEVRPASTPGLVAVDILVRDDNARIEAVAVTWPGRRVSTFLRQIPSRITVSWRCPPWAR